MKKILLLTLLLLTLTVSAKVDSTSSNIVITIHTPTNDLEKSLDFYKKLHYTVLSEANPTIVSDGQVTIEINPDKYARAGIKVYGDSWTNEIKLLKKFTSVYNIEEGYLVNDINGCWIYLMEKKYPVEPKVIDMQTAITGTFAGLCIESANMGKSLEIWKAIGFHIEMGDYKSGYMMLMHKNGFGLSLMKPLMCPHLFFNPSLTFFNGEKNIEIIAKIREAGIPIAQEITTFNKEGIVDNIIIQDPGGYGFFIFSD